jgi:hypothetical protein
MARTAVWAEKTASTVHGPAPGPGVVFVIWAPSRNGSHWAVCPGSARSLSH